jgi:hypothetical protein
MKDTNPLSIPALVGKPDVARRYSVCIRTVDNWIALGVVPYQKIGGLIRFDLAKVDAALARFEVSPRGGLIDRGEV